MKNTKQTEQQVCEPMDLLDVLLDRDNRDPIPLMDETGKVLNFEQVAVIPYDAEGQDRVLYVVLKPIDHIDGIGEDEAIVFKTDTDKNGNTVLRLEEDEKRSVAIFEKYYDLIESSQADADDEDTNHSNDRISQLRQELMSRLMMRKGIEENQNKTFASINTYDASETLKMVDGFDYSEKLDVAKLVAFKLFVFGINIELKTIQIGIDRTRYVFDFLPSKIRISDLKRYELDVKACIKTDNHVEVIAPYGSDQLVAIDVEHDTYIDAYCKKALLFWLTKYQGKASIASIQRNLGIGFNRSGSIMDTLQKLNCVESLEPSDSMAKPLHVKITKEDVEVLFPQSLCWED